MARPYPHGRGEYEVRVGMRSEDGECLCCFLRCPNELRGNRTHYPCDAEMREYSFLRQVVGYEMDGDLAGKGDAGGLEQQEQVD